MPSAAQAAGSPWTKQIDSSTLWWTSIASSSDGSKLVASAVVDGAGDYVYTSTDAGASWVTRTSAGLRGWSGVASSADGTKLVATTLGDYIFTSTDSGASWTQQTNSGQADWYSVASSSDGSKLVAVTYGNYISTSTDSGATWTQHTSAGKRNWTSVSSSSDGTKLAAATDRSDYLYVSNDSGATWLALGSQGIWAGVALSSDGTKIIATQDGYVYTSDNSGISFTKLDSAGYTNWVAVASSADATKLAVATTTTVKISTDAGSSWTTQDVVGNVWLALASNSDGSKIAAITNLGGLFTYAEPAVAAAPVFSASTPAVPDTRVGGTSPTQTETITNTGNADLVFGANAVTKLGSEYDIIADSCSSQTIAPNGTCTVAYTFTPTALGRRSADFMFASNAVSSPDRVTINGTALGSPVLSPSTTAVPNTRIGSTSPTQTETITNTGNADLEFGANAVTKLGSEFNIVADNCSSHTVAINGTCTLTYTFSPTAIGSRSADLLFASNAVGSPDRIALNGTGLAALSKVKITKIDKTTVSIKGGTTIIITGTGFNVAATVKIAGLKATVTKRTGTTKLTVRTPAHKSGKVSLVVTNPDTGSATFKSLTYKK
jgi:hypothetical protein